MSNLTVKIGVIQQTAKQFVSTMAKTYKKLQVVKLSTDFAEATKVSEFPLVPPEPNHVLIRNLYAGVNATDINISAGRYIVGSDPKLPYDAGLEAIGIVEAVGSDVKSVKVGQPVAAYNRKSYTEYVYTTEDTILPIPEVKPEFIALPVCGLTAAIGLDKAGHLQPGEKVLITAAAGGTGHIGVQWAKRKGCHVIGTTSNAEKVKVLKELGCDRVINYREEDLDAVLKNEYPDGVDVIWETIGGKVFDTLFEHLAIRGRLVVVGNISDYKGAGLQGYHLPLSTDFLKKSKVLSGFFLSNFKQYFPDYLAKLIELVQIGSIKIILDFGDKVEGGRFEGVESIARGVSYLHTAKSIGKVAIKIQK